MHHGGAESRRFQMATNAQNPAVKTPKAKKPPVSLTERMKSQLNAAALRGKLSLDDLSDLEQHVKKIAGFLGA